MLANLVVHSSDYNGNQSQQGLQWTHLVEHQSEINQSQARQVILECNCPIRDLGSQTCYSRMHKARQTIPRCIGNMHGIKEATEAQNIRQAELQSSRLEDKLTQQPQHLRRQGKGHKA